jgi:hypothetical protein
LEWREQHQGRPLLQNAKFSKLDIEMACKELKANSCSCCGGPLWIRELYLLIFYWSLSALCKRGVQGLACQLQASGPHQPHYQNV